MKRVWMLGLIVMTVAGTGCSVKGKWSLSSVDPEAARRDFEFGSLTLQEDGTFYGEAQTVVVEHAKVESTTGASFESQSKTPGIKTSSGTYTAENGILTLRPHNGPPIPYDYSVSGSELKLEKFWEGQKVKTTFKRIE